MKKVIFILLLLIIGTNPLFSQQVFTTDVVVQGSECIGLDCPNIPTFGFNTLILSENNVRIRFEDTSNSASFPGNDWTLVANDSSNGGENYFAIEDATAARHIFKLESGAPVNSIFIEDTGFVGFGTGNPAVNIHQVYGNSPALRLEQDGSSGFTPQVWDIAGNETNFFIRDVTNGSTLPFKIKPGAPTNTLYLNASGNVAIGGVNDTHKLYVNGDAAVSGDVFVLSDKRIKKDIADLNYGIAEIMQLSPKSYHYNTLRFSSLNLPAQNQIGLIAQEVELILPDIITQEHTTVTEGGKKMALKGVNYTKLVPVLIQAIKEQQAQLDAKELQLSELTSEVNLLKNQMRSISNALNLNTTIKQHSGAIVNPLKKDNPNAPIVRKEKVKEPIIKLNNGRNER